MASKKQKYKVLTGRRYNFYLHSIDRKRLNELLEWLRMQGRPASLSAVVKACLAAAKPGDELLLAFESVLEQDLRNHKVKE
jgi:hypothetical protein